MRITAFIVFILSMQVYAKSFGQTEKLSLSMNSTIKDVIERIEDISGYRFVLKYNESILDKKVDVRYTNESIEHVLDNLFKDTGFTYKIVDRYIAIRPDNESDVIDQQQKSVSGKVTDSSGGSLPGVSIIVMGTTAGTITDSNGNYIILNVPENATLKFSFVGMKSQEVAVKNNLTINVTLTEETLGIDEVVAIGYGTTKKATVTGSISTIDGTQLQSSPAINFTNSLAGRLSGLIAISRSGEPGYDGATLRIRGSNTLGDNSPLIVVDGIPNRGLEGLNSSDIESITVLKDASSAIYGTQAANGVILVTTKRGSIGKPSITTSFNQGWSMPTVLPQMADAATYAQVQNEINSYRGWTESYSQEDIQKFRDGSDPWGHPNTDWFSEVYKPFSLQNNTNISITGGSESMKYFVSLGNKYQDGNYKNSATNYSQYDFRSNMDGKISNNITMSLDIAGRYEDRNYPTKSSGTIFNATLRSFPTMPAFWPSGQPGPDIERGENPVVLATNQTGYEKEKRYIMQSNIKVNVIVPWVKGLSVTGNASVDKGISNSKIWQTPWFLYSWDGESFDGNNIPVLSKGSRGYSEPRLRQSMNDGQTITMNVLVNYEHSFYNKHNIKMLAGAERITGESMNFWAFRRYYISTVSQELFAGGDIEKDNNGSSSNSARLNYFGRFNYDYLQKYMLEFVGRYDGSYKFPANSRFGFFPGISLGWRISEETFWKDNVGSINYFKLRGSWGQTGNDRIEEYQYLSSYGFNDTYVFNYDLESKTLGELRIPNTNITWEIANQSNIGFDAHLLGEKLTLSGDYFYNLRTNILWWRNASVPATTGLSLPRENIGKVVNQGFEFDLGYNNKLGEFSYKVSLNGAYQKNKIKFWDETPGAPDYQKSTGHPMNAKLLYHAIGIFKDQAAVDAYPHWEGARPGDIIFEDVNNDKVIDGLDQVRYDKTDMPTFTGGLNIGLEYKDFYADILFQGAAGAVTTHTTESGLFGNFRVADVEGRWTEDNPNASKPRAWNNVDEYWYQSGGNNTFHLMDADYVRLKNLEIGYNVPAKIRKNLKIDGLRIYLSGTNILTFTKMVDYDPEANSGAHLYPPLKVYNAGISLTF